ncbi:endonuclease III domain-containing protein [Thermodesulfobacteriota bacterium]
MLYSRYKRKKFFFRALTKKLVKQYNTPDLGNKEDPLDEIIYIMLSLQTNDSKFRRAFDNLKCHFGSWEKVRGAAAEEIIGQICFSGLAEQKAMRIKSALERINLDRGETNLDFLFNLSDKDAERYLTSLPGVGTKIAKCVLLYSLKRNVFPIDSNTIKIYKRLGIISRNTLNLKQQRELEQMVPPEFRYDLHVNLVVHARSTCKTKKPKCNDCIINKYCLQWVKSN